MGLPWGEGGGGSTEHLFKLQAAARRGVPLPMQGGETSPQLSLTIIFLFTSDDQDIMEILCKVFIIVQILSCVHYNDDLTCIEFT